MTNKPEVVAWYTPPTKNTLPVVGLNDRSKRGEPLIRLSDYEALQAECECSSLRRKLAEQQPALAKYQPCGCVICTCEHETQCQGCGAKHCGTHPIGQLYQQPAPDVTGLIICDECHAKCSEPYTGLFASHSPDEEPCIMCECSSLRRQLASRSGVPVEPDVAVLVTLLEHARCNTCDGSGAFCDGHGQAHQCQWCHDRSIALAAYRKGGEE